MLTPSQEQKTFVFYLVPEFTLLAFSSAIEVLRLANQVTGHEHYRWRLISADGQPVIASNGVYVSVDSSLATERILLFGLQKPFMSLVCSGRRVQDYTNRSMDAWLRECRRMRIHVAGLCTGTYLLARAGILQDRRCTIHWENSPAFAEQFNRSALTAGIFEFDDGIYTSAGTGSFDMMLHIVRQAFGSKTAAEICSQALIMRMRDKSERQRLAFASSQGVNNAIIQAAVHLMEDNMSSPISLTEVGFRLHLSRRQIERLFRNQLSCSPARYYLKLRIERAKLLLTQTAMPVVDVAVACGFVSASHFSKCYRQIEGNSPQADRKLWGGAIGASCQQRSCEHSLA
ncbi:AraC family transcriptional regulator [Mesorhizobium loti]|uniref:AraC family transcriptional regulator n=1 Tax=Rhizobium loti TaxID=381 RepID=A0A101KP45_RHILI|nr:AraC family transcriptional regulator [Mesorhizobium loti]